MLYSALLVGRVLLPRHELLELARRDVDAGDDVALAQQLQLHLAADLVAEIAVVDALLRERLRQVGERDVVALGDVVERAVEHLVGHVDADAVGALELDLLDDQPFEDLPAQTRCAAAARFPACADAAMTSSVCASSWLTSTTPSLTTAAMRSSSSPLLDSSRVWANAVAPMSASPTSSHGTRTNLRARSICIGSFWREFLGFRRAGGVSPNRPFQESIGAHSDTRQAV